MISRSYLHQFANRTPINNIYKQDRSYLLPLADGIPINNINITYQMLSPTMQKIKDEEMIKL